MMKNLMDIDLPVRTILPELASTLERGSRAVLCAPPGAGKTTLLPAALLECRFLQNRRILMLEPRRLAARMAAARIAALLGESPGGRVGYRLRGESCVGPECRIEVVTEGILTRMLQHDPELAAYGMVIFDEFHERSVHADLGLALALDVQENLREDLRILVMSATLDSGRIAALLGGAPSLAAEGRMFPVEVRYGDSGCRPAELPQRAAAAVLSVLAREEGSILVFLPGAGEIERTAGILNGAVPENVSVAPLYGALERQRQDLAVLPPPEGRRKVVLATNIAESSLTIQGVRVVIDGGYERRMEFDIATGMAALKTRRISRASAEQRAGRAGRLEGGAVYRLYSLWEFQAMEEFSPPEISVGDLTPTALEVAAWGARFEDLKWLDPPSAAATAEAGTLLHELGALDGGGRITRLGRSLAEFPAHPRLAAMLLRAGTLNLAPLGCELAALLETRPAAGSCDLEEALRAMRRRPTAEDRLALRQLLAQCGIRPTEQPLSEAGLL